MHMTVKNGERCSSATAYLGPALNRPNLKVITNVLARRVVLDGRCAVGVEYDHSGQRTMVNADREVLICAGAVGSPHLLQLSGIGPRDVLREAGVEVLHHLPGVGGNLQDHLEVYFQFTCRQPITLNAKLGVLSKAAIGLRWWLFRSGLGATNHFEAGAFVRSRAGVKWPDIQYHFLPAAIRYDGKAALKGHGFQVHVGPNKPRSRGRIELKSPDPQVAPEITFNYLQSERDTEDWRACIRLTREIMAQPAFDPYRGREIQPGDAISDDEAVDAWVRANVESAYHPAGTCRMGDANDPLAVVDPECRVIGLERLRVIDSSIMPTVTNGNLNAPTIMLAEKAADLVLGKAPLPAADVDGWIDPQWRERQRPGSPTRPAGEA